MAENSSIQWTDHTFNPWRGCTKVSPGCANCYAETLAKRNPAVLGVWGDKGTRVVAAEAQWRQPFKWNKAAESAGVRHRVFCASLADVFEEREDLIEPRRRLFGVIAETPNLDWLLLTKRPDRAAEWLPIMARRVRDILIECGRRRPLMGRDHMLLDSLVDGHCFPNVWIGTTVENQEQAEKRLPILCRIPAAVRFVSAEPLLESVDFDGYEAGVCMECSGSGETYGHYFSSTGVGRCGSCGRKGTDESNLGVDWIIVGGESGPNARPFNIDWARRIVKYRNAPVFVKQVGARPFSDPTLGTRYDDRTCLKVRDSHGGDWDEWPEDLRVREFPAGKAVKA